MEILSPHFLIHFSPVFVNCKQEIELLHVREIRVYVLTAAQTVFQHRLTYYQCRDA